MTKIFALTAAALVGSATLAAAETSYFSVGNALDRTGSLELGTVRAEGDGTIALYDYHAGMIGELLGQTNVRAGANANVHVGVSKLPDNDVIAILDIGGQTAASRVYDVRDN